MTKGRYRMGLLAIAIAGLAACGGGDDDDSASAGTGASAGSGTSANAGSGASAGTVASATVKAPSELMVSELDGGAHVVWKDNSDNESGFMIERMSSHEDWKVVGMVPFDTTQYHDPNLAAGMYMYRVMAMPKSGGHETGAYSGEVMLVINADSSAGAAGTGAVDAGPQHNGG